MDRNKDPANDKLAPDIDTIISNIIKTYSHNNPYEEGVKTKLNDFVLNYLYYILHESDQIAESQQSKNIDGSHVKAAINTLHKRINTITRNEVEQSTEYFKNVKGHNLNTDESQLISHREPQDPGEYFVRQDKAQPGIFRKYRCE